MIISSVSQFVKIFCPEPLCLSRTRLRSGHQRCVGDVADMSRSVPLLRFIHDRLLNRITLYINRGPVFPEL